MKWAVLLALAVGGCSSFERDVIGLPGQSVDDAFARYNHLATGDADHRRQIYVFSNETVKGDRTYRCEVEIRATGKGKIVTAALRGDMAACDGMLKTPAPDAPQ